MKKIFSQTLCQYWPKQGGASIFGEFYVEVVSLVEGDGFIRRNIRIMKKVIPLLRI